MDCVGGSKRKAEDDPNRVRLGARWFSRDKTGGKESPFLPAEFGTRTGKIYFISKRRILSRYSSSRELAVVYWCVWPRCIEAATLPSPALSTRSQAPTTSPDTETFVQRVGFPALDSGAIEKLRP